MFGFGSTVQPLLLLLLLIVSPLGFFISRVSAAGIQSGPASSSSFAGGMFYDTPTQRVYLSGVTYDAPSWISGSTSNTASGTPQCFVVSLPLLSTQYWTLETGVALTGPSACPALTVLGEDTTLFVAGTSSSSSNDGSNAGTTQGFGTTLLVDSTATTTDNSLFFLPPALDRIDYPQFVVTQGRTIYTVSLTSLDTLETTATSDVTTPNLLQSLPYGSSFDVTVRKLTWDRPEFLGIPSGPLSITPTWQVEFPVNQEEDGADVPPRVFVGGIAVRSSSSSGGTQELILAGSTRGLGAAYGAASGEDEDGFVTVLDTKDGQILRSERIGTPAPDVVMGLCRDPNDDDYLYVVGATQGIPRQTILPTSNGAPEGSLGAMVSKLRMDTLTTIWSRKLEARVSNDASIVTGAYAVGCAVQNNVVYVAGGVEAGASMIDDASSGQLLDSKGGDDVWAMGISKSSGETLWMNQVGSPGDDRLSRHGGVQIDVHGSLLLYGETNGSLYRTTTTTNIFDIFFMVLKGEDGTVHQTIEGVPVAAPTAPPVAATNPPVALPVAALPTPFTPHAAQLSGPYNTAAMVYNGRDNKAILTGQYYQGSNSKCFVTDFDLTTGQTRSPSPNLLDGRACLSLDYSQIQNQVYLGGVVDADGVLLQIDAESFEVDAEASLTDAAAQYPVAMVATTDATYVALQVSDLSEANPSAGEGRPNLVKGRPYGADYYLVLQRRSNDDAGLTKEWSTSFQVDETSESILVSDMVLAGNTLVVVGATRGTSADGPFGSSNPTGDMDGFLLKIDPLEGSLQSINGHRSSTRLDSINQKDDWAFGVCTNPFAAEAVYVVGMSQGKVRDLSDAEQPPDGTTHAFVAKVKVETLTAEWLHHFVMDPGTDSLAQAAAYGCAVTTDGLVYVAGMIEAGATIQGATKSPGAADDDVFVAQLNGINGQVNWIQQVGSAERDHLAQGGGIAVDANGNAIVYAETLGNMFNEWTGTSDDHKDAVVFTMSKEDGAYANLYTPGSSPVAPPTQAPVTIDDDSGPDNKDFLPDSITALQTGPDVGPTYAGGMYYSESTNSIYLAGATYGSFDGPGVQGTSFSSCFYGVMSLPNLEWRERNVYGTSSAPEACSAVSLTSVDSTVTAIVVGSTEDGGLLTSLGTNQAKQYGMALDLASLGGRFELQGGAIMNENPVQFPISVESSGTSAWVVSMTAKDATVNPDFDKTSTDERPNLTTGGIYKYGSKYRIAIDKYTIQRAGGANADAVLESSMQLKWRKPFETADQESIYVSDLITVQGGSSLIVVGSTKGTKNAADMDGIMAKIDPEEGTFQADARGDRAVAYFASVTGSDDWILGACPDPDDNQAFYVVGATQGKMDKDASRDRKDVTVHAVAAKIHVDKLTAIWVKQFSVTHASGTDEKGAAASAFGCSVIPGTGTMYIAGNVENGAVMDQGNQKSAGRDDIFVAKLLTKDGDTAWMKQVGSNGDDRVAHGGGVKVDANGNAVVYGDTNGSLFRDRSSDGSSQHYSDLFVMVFNQADGSHLDPLIATPTEKLPTDTSTPTEWYPSGVTRNKTTLQLVSFGIAALCLLMVALCFCCYARHRARKRAEARKASVFYYLQKFDVEDIDLRKSPPGGWHGTYLNRLAFGKNQVDETSGEALLGANELAFETAPLTHSSIVRDSLFMDTAAPPSLGGSNGFGYRDDPEEDDINFLEDELDALSPRSFKERAESLRDII